MGDDVRGSGGQRTVSRFLVFVLIVLAGITIGTCFIIRYGFKAIAAALLMVGLRGFVVVVLMQLAIGVACGVAWLLLVAPMERISAWPFVLGRLVRNAVSEILLLPNVGGFAAGARAASAVGLSGLIAFSSTVVDVTIELAAQLAYVALGLIIFAAHYPRNPVAAWVGTTLAIGTVVALGFAAAQLHGFGLVEALVARLGSPELSASAAAVRDSIGDMYSRPVGVIQGLGLHFLCWVAGAAQVWFALNLMHANLGFASVISIESFLCAARAAAFAVPAAVGVQEGVYVVLAGIFGIAPGTLLALSLLKRARDSVLGVPPLLVWQIIEARRLTPIVSAPAQNCAVTDAAEFRP